MWWKMLLLLIYLVALFVLSRVLEAVSYYEGGYLASRLLDPVSLSVRKLKTLLDQRGVSYAGVVERQELTQLIETSGETTEGELESANRAEETSATSTNFSCGAHFFEEVEDTKDSVWVVQVIQTSSRSSDFMKHDNWNALIKKVARFGVRTGVFDCSLDRRYCNQKKWFTPRLVLALPQEYKAKANVSLYNYLGSRRVQPILDWINYHLASRIRRIENITDLQNAWFNFSDESQTQLRIIIFSAMNIPPMFLSVLSVKYTGRVHFGMVDTNTKVGKSIKRKTRLKRVPCYKILMPERNLTFGKRSGEYLNYDSMALFLRTLQPEVNDMFLLSLVLLNVMCWLEFAVVSGSIYRRLGSLLWLLGKWNCLLILLWLPVLAMFQIPYMSLAVQYALTLLRVLASTTAASCLRHDWLWLTSSGSGFLLLTFLIYTAIVGILHHLFLKPTQQQVEPAVSSGGDWWNLNWDYMSYLFRPVATLTRPMGPQNLDLEVGMELLIERLAVPNFWLRPMISSDYIKDLPSWRYTGQCIDSDIPSDSEGTKIDCEEMGYCSDSCLETQSQFSSRPFMFICEKCRALQNNNEQKRKSQEELEQERAESESACAKFLMDGDYKCQCTHEGSNEHTTRKSPKKERYKHRPRSMSDSDMRSTRWGDDFELHDSAPPEDTYPTSQMPSGMLPCTECAICLEKYRFAAALCGLPCGHTFHHQCIMGWLTRDNHCCPVCRWPAYKAKPCSVHLHAE